MLKEFPQYQKDLYKLVVIQTKVLIYYLRCLLNLFHEKFVLLLFEVRLHLTQDYISLFFRDKTQQLLLLKFL